MLKSKNDCLEIKVGGIIMVVLSLVSFLFVVCFCWTCGFVIGTFETVFVGSIICIFCS